MVGVYLGAEAVGFTSMSDRATILFDTFAIQSSVYTCACIRPCPYCCEQPLVLAVVLLQFKTEHLTHQQCVHSALE